jgi:hypothetical protein
LRHAERPRFNAADRKRVRSSVNETKSALFSLQSNDRFARHAGTEKFAMIIAQSTILRARQSTNLTDRHAEQPKITV